MIVTFFSNFLSDHQLPLCQEFLRILGENNFYFVAHTKIDQERIMLGFEDMNEIYPFVVKAYEGGEPYLKARNLMLCSDVVIIGSCDNMPFEERVLKNKLTFRYNERLLKKGDYLWFHPRVQLGIYKNWTKFKHNNLYALCASAFTSRDLALFGYPRDKCFTWGYFPIVKEYDDLEVLFHQKLCCRFEPDCISVLWAGRFVKYKHPEYAIKIAQKLKKDGYRFHLNMLGTGHLYPILMSMIKEFDLENEVSLLGAVPPNEVRMYMENSEVYLFTSDRNEGWGVVLNEAFNSCCAVVANKSIGSVPFMLNDYVNGLLYDNDLNQAYECVKMLFNDSELRRSIATQAYLSIINVWNPRTAVSNFLSLVNLLHNSKYINNFKNEPCAPVVL